MDKKTETKEDMKEETKTKEKKEEKKLTPKEVMIEEKAATLTDTYGKSFDKGAYKTAASAYLEKHDNLDGFDTSIFIKNKDDQIKNDEGLCFGLEERDGKVISRGSNGVVFEGKNFEEVNDKVCSYMKNDSLSKGKEPKIGFHSNDDTKKEIFSRNAIMKHNVTILAGWPEDQKFWQDLKKDYLSDKSHKQEDWERMTRKIPDDVMQRTPEEKARNKKLNDADIIAQIRKGNNPNLQTTSTSAPTEQMPKPPVSNDGQHKIPVSDGSENNTPTQDKDGKADTVALIDQMRRGVNPNVPETMPAEKAQPQRPDDGKPLTEEEIKAAVLRQAQHLQNK